MINFLAGEGQNFFVFLKYPFHGLSSGIWYGHVQWMSIFPFLLHFGSGADFWVGQEVDGTEQKFFVLFEIFFTWTFQWYLTQPYLMNTHFWSFWRAGPIFGWGRKWMGQASFFFILNTPLMVDNYCIWYEVICLNRKWIDRWMYPGSFEILAQLKLSRCKCLVKNILKLIMEPKWPKKLGSQSWIFKYI